MSDAKPTIYQFSLGDYVEQNLVRQAGWDPGFSHILRKIQETATIQEAWDTQEALDLLGQDEPPKAIYITDSGITKPKNREVSKRVVEYARNGGTVILGLAFASNVNFAVFNSYMAQHWGLPWKYHSYTSEDCAINIAATGPPGKQWLNGLQALYPQRSMYINNVDRTACWYLPAPYPSDPYGDRPEAKWRVEAPTLATLATLAPRTQTPVAFAPVGKGRLGYTGDVKQLESTDAVVLSMLGLNNRVRWCTCGEEPFVI